MRRSKKPGIRLAEGQSREDLGALVKKTTRLATFLPNPIGCHKQLPPNTSSICLTPPCTPTKSFSTMPYTSMNSYHTGLGLRTFGTHTITRQAKPSWVVAKKDYPTSQQVTHAPVDAVCAPLMCRVFRSCL